MLLFVIRCRNKDGWISGRARNQADDFDLKHE